MNLKIVIILHIFGFYYANAFLPHFPIVIVDNVRTSNETQQSNLTRSYHEYERFLRHFL